MNNLRLGSYTPTKIYLGDTEVEKIYLGSDLIYQKQV